MSKQDIIRAWKDEEYRNSLSEEQRSQLPENPAGILELSDTQMESVAGGLPPETAPIICCPTMGGARCGFTKRCFG